MAAKRCAWIPAVVESRRVNGSPRQVHAARLASIHSCYLASAEIRAAWWVRADEILTELAGEDDVQWERLFEALTEKVRYEWPQQEEAKRPRHAAFTATEAAAVLGITWPAPVVELKARFRQLAKRHHPDLGGRHEVSCGCGRHSSC